MSHGEVREVYIVALIVFPRGVGGIAATLGDGFVDFGLVDIVEERTEDDAVLAEFVLQVGTHAVHDRQELQGGTAYIEAVLHQSASRTEVEAGRGWRFEETEFFKVFNHIFHAFALGRTEQPAEFSLVFCHFINFQIT